MRSINWWFNGVYMRATTVDLIGKDTVVKIKCPF